MIRPDLTVLVVDDDQEIRGIVMDVLQRAGYRVLEAADGRGALEIAERMQPDLVVLDMAMPGGMDGVDVARELQSRARFANVPLVALSGRRGVQDRQRALDAGCRIYLTKPCSPDRLRQVVATMLGDPPPGKTELGS